MIPSIYAHTIGAIILAIGIVHIAYYFAKLKSKDPYQILILILVSSIVITLHGISHIGLEYLYGYNPSYLITSKFT